MYIYVHKSTRYAGEMSFPLHRLYKQAFHVVQIRDFLTQQVNYVSRSLYDGIVDLIAAKILILLLTLKPTTDSEIILNYVT